jgi:hypothetical protein
MELDSVPLSGGTLTTIATWGSAGARSIAIDSKYAYFGYSVISGDLGVIAKVPLGGGAETTLASWSMPSMPSGPDYIALGGGDLYWTYHTTSQTFVERLAPGGTPEAVDAGPLLNAFISADESNAYFTDSTGLEKGPSDGGPVMTLVASPTSGAIVLDDRYAYFVGLAVTDPDSLHPKYSYVLFSVLLVGGSGFDNQLAGLCPKTVDGVPLAVDATSIYFGFDGKIMKLPKK